MSKKKIENVYSDVHEFFERHISVIYRRNIGGLMKWCPRWFDHPEALLHMSYLHASWEEANAKGAAALARWTIEIGYPMMDRLMHDKGPFDSCDDGHYVRKGQEQYLPHEPINQQ
ncbi:MAG: DUF4913 domain-containing protein [Actinomycetaceae bacterium]|nr:DUF4913 domain-containing protein [Actinomycetaceae bacterium]